MNRHLLVLTIVLLPLFAGAHQIPIGYHSKFAKIWRFYEKDELGRWIPKIMIYNITDKPINVCMKVVVSERETQESDRKLMKQYLNIDNDTTIKPVTIAAHDYGIYNTEVQNYRNPTGFFDAVIINGWGAGIMSVRGIPKITEDQYRYYSYEGVDGNAGCLIGTDDMFVKPRKKGRVSLYYQCKEMKVNYPMTHYDFEPVIYNGDVSLKVRQRGSDWTKVDTKNPKQKFSVDMQHIDDFYLDAEYTINNTDSIAGAGLGFYFCNGCYRGIELPVFANPRP